MRDAARAADLERGFRQTVAADLSRLLPQGARLALIEIDLLCDDLEYLRTAYPGAY